MRAVAFSGMAFRCAVRGVVGNMVGCRSVATAPRYPMVRARSARRRGAQRNV